MSFFKGLFGGGQPSFEPIPSPPTRADASAVADAQRIASQRKTILAAETGAEGADFAPSVLRSVLGSG